MATDNTFWAYDGEQQVILAADAVGSTDYGCPDCKQPVHRRKGHVRLDYWVRDHYFHPDGSGGGCMSDQHKFMQSFMLHYRGPLEFRLPCSHGEFVLENYTSVQVEYQIDQYFVDVAYFIDEVLIAVVEIKHTHEVDEEKWAHLVQLNVPIFEVVADGGGHVKPSVLRVAGYDCKPCADYDTENQAREEHWVQITADTRDSTSELAQKLCRQILAADAKLAAQVADARKSKMEARLWQSIES